MNLHEFFKKLVYFVLIIHATDLSSQEAIDQLLPIRVNGQWGFINAAGKTIIQPNYDSAEPLGEFAAVSKDGKIGLIDRDENIILPFQYQSVYPLDSHYFAFMEDSLWGIQAIKTKAVVTPSFEEITYLSPTRLRVRKDGHYGVITPTGKVIIPSNYDAVEPVGLLFFKAIQDTVTVLTDSLGSILLADTISGFYFPDEDYIFYQKDMFWGAISPSSGVLVQPEWLEIRAVNSNYFAIKNERLWCLFSLIKQDTVTNQMLTGFQNSWNNRVIVRENNKVGLMDNTGNWLLPTEYENIEFLTRGYYQLSANGKLGVSDSAGKIIIQPNFDHIYPFEGELIKVIHSNGTGVFNTRGDSVVAAIFDEIQINNNVAKAYAIDRKISVFRFNSNGLPKNNEEYKNVRTIRLGSKMDRGFSLNNNNINTDRQDEREAYVWFYSSSNKKWGLKETASGKIIIKALFHSVYVNSDLGITLVKHISMNGTGGAPEEINLYGLVDHVNGKMLLAPRFRKIFLDDFRVTGNQIARCIDRNKRYACINIKGTQLLAGFSYIGDFREGYARANKGGKLKMLTGYEEEKMDEFLDHVGALGLSSKLTRKPGEQPKNLVCKRGYWGYVNTNGEVALKLTFEHAKDFIKGRAIVKRNGKWGVISNNNQTMIDIKYDYVAIAPGSDSTIFVLANDTVKYGLMNTSGNFTIDMNYADIKPFREGLASGKLNERWGYINEEEKAAIPFSYKKVRGFSENLAAAKLKSRWGYIDNLGNFVIAEKYQRVGDFHENLAWVKDKGGYRFINETGKPVIKGGFSKAYDFNDGLAVVMVRSKYGIIDKDGKWVAKAKYRKILPFENQQYTIVKSSRGYGIINRQGKKIVPAKYDWISMFDDGIASIKDGGKPGIIDTTGNTTFFEKYSNIYQPQEGLIRVRQKGKYGFMSYSGDLLIETQFRKSTDFQEGMAFVGSRGRYGIINTTGELVVPYQFKRFSPFQEGMALVSDTTQGYYFISKQGKLLFGKRFDIAQPFQGGTALVKLQGKWGMINTHGHYIIPPSYDKIERLDNNSLKVGSHRFYGLADNRGRIIIEAEYHILSQIENGIFRIEDSQRIGYLDSDGEWIWKPTR